MEMPLILINQRFLLLELRVTQVLCNETETETENEKR